MSRYLTRSFRAIEHRFTIELDNPSVGLYLDDIFEGLIDAREREAGESDRYRLVSVIGPETTQYRLDWCGMHLATCAELELAVQYLLWHINQLAVKESQKHLLIHAAGLERAGKGILLPAPQEAGKTTLSAALVQRGFGYLTDEAVAIRVADQRALAYPKPLSVDRGSWCLLRNLEPEIPPELLRLHGEQWQVPPQRIRTDAIVASTAVHYIVSPQYIAGSPTKLLRLSRAEALRLLAENSFNFHRFPSGLKLLADVVRLASCYRLTMGSLTVACELMEEVMTEDRGDDGYRRA